MNRIDEILKIDVGVASQNVSAGVSSTVYQDMSEYRKILIVGEANISSGTVVMTALLASDASGTGSVTSRSVTLTSTKGLAYIEIDATELPATKYFVGVKLKASGAIYSSAVMYRDTGRYKAVTQAVDEASVAS